MRTIEVPFQDWRRVLDEFSAIHEGWLISVDILSALMGAQPELHDLPLLGVTVGGSGARPSITIAAARSADDHLAHTIESPARVWLERTDAGATAALEIESEDGTKTILRFRPAVLPEMVDGIGRARG